MLQTQVFVYVDMLSVSFCARDVPLRAMRVDEQVDLSFGTEGFEQHFASKDTVFI